jgi:hypothetical protein
VHVVGPTLRQMSLIGEQFEFGANRSSARAHHSK